MNTDVIEDKKLDKKIVKSFKTKKSLSDDIFDSDFFMKKEIKDKLIDITNAFIDFIDIKFFIHDIILTGSISNYNWSSYSDIDLHIVIDFNESEYEANLLKNLLDTKKNLWNKTHNIKIKDYDVELYVQNIDEIHISSGIYSVLYDKWIKKPKFIDTKFNEQKILDKSFEYSKKIDLLYKKNKMGVDIADDLERLTNKLKKFRKSGLKKNGEYSFENLTFKLLRRNGYIAKLMELSIKNVDNKLSLP